ncbi:hypothetical protein [Nocardioides hungaricus]
MRAVALAVATAAALTGCSGSPEAEPAPAPTGVAGVAWSPCDDLTARQVGEIAGEPVKERTGTRASPRCTFVPATKGGPAYDVSYLFFDGGLDAALAAMGTVGKQLESVDVPGAEAARLAVKERKDGVLVTGFVQADGLVQSVNAVRLEPYDSDALVRSVTDLMALLAKNASQANPE